MMSAPPDPADITSATLPLAKLQSDHVPQICVKTGQRAQCLVPTLASVTPRWGWLLMLLGGFPLFIARRRLFPHEELALPARNFVYERYEWTKRGMFGCFLVAGVVAIASVATLSAGGLVLSYLVAVCTTAGWLLIVPRFWVSAELLPGSPTQVRLHGIHRTAANAINGGA